MNENNTETTNSSGQTTNSSVPAPNTVKLQVMALVPVTFEAELQLDSITGPDSIAQQLIEGKKTSETIHYHRVAAMKSEAVGDGADVLAAKLEAYDKKKKEEEAKQPLPVRGNEGGLAI